MALNSLPDDTKLPVGLHSTELLTTAHPRDMWQAVIAMSDQHGQPHVEQYVMPAIMHRQDADEVWDPENMDLESDSLMNIVLKWVPNEYGDEFVSEDFRAENFEWVRYYLTHHPDCRYEGKHPNPFLEMSIDHMFVMCKKSKDVVDMLHMRRLYGIPTSIGHHLLYRKLVMTDIDNDDLGGIVEVIHAARDMLAPDREAEVYGFHGNMGGVLYVLRHMNVWPVWVDSMQRQYDTFMQG